MAEGRNKSMNYFEFSFWLSTFIIFYTYVGYPVILYLMAKARNRAVKKEEIFPTVSLIIAAYNEENGIEDKIKNCLNLDYPLDALEIIIASDGSTDNTNILVNRYADQGIRLLTLPRRGKIFALDEAVTQSVGEILVFSDANTHFQSKALNELISNFSDPVVGGVCGNQMHYKDKGDSTVSCESIYWNYDKWIKKLESLTGNIVSADGAIYAIRRELYQMPELISSTDDFAISTGVIEKGFRLVFESQALVYEHLSASANVEFKRKKRIITRGLRGVLLRKKLFNPFQYGIYSWILFSHKLLRRIIPFFLLILFFSNLLVATHGKFYLVVSQAQMIFYLLALVGYLMSKTSMRGSKIFTVPFYFCLANAAAFLAVLNFLTGKQIQNWDPIR